MLHTSLKKSTNCSPPAPPGAWLSTELGLSVTRFESGPLGGDQQIGAKVTEGDLDFLIFFWDPLETQPHDVDVKALLRIAVVYNVPIACNRASADFIVSSPLMSELRATAHRLQAPDPPGASDRHVTVPRRQIRDLLRDGRSTT